MLINSTWGLSVSITNNLIIPGTTVINKDKFKIIKLKTNTTTLQNRFKIRKCISISSRY